MRRNNDDHKRKSKKNEEIYRKSSHVQSRVNRFLFTQPSIEYSYMRVWISYRNWLITFLNSNTLGSSSRRYVTSSKICTNVWNNFRKFPSTKFRKPFNWNRNLHVLFDIRVRFTDRVPPQGGTGVRSSLSQWRKNRMKVVFIHAIS